MVFDHDSISDYLHAELSERVERNPRYSLRAFAKALSINPAELSQVLRKQRKISLNSALKVSKALGFSPAETKHFLLLLQKEKSQSLGLPLEFWNDSGGPAEKTSLETAEFEKIGDWYHFAIINLLDTKGFRWNAQHISRRLGISATEAQLAMRNLERTGLVHLGRSGNSSSAKANWEVSSHIPSAAIRKYHRQILEKAAHSLENVPLDEREFQGIGLVIRKSDLRRLKAEIDRFTDVVRSRFHKPKEDHVYQLEVALFPLTQDRKKEIEEKL